ncbi:MAG: hypothetical protein GX335_09330 [Firmicutes bacterium]|nr:hypothetical protein [Bacillota bacterium]
MGRWFVAFGLLIIAIILAFIIFSVTGVIDAPTLFWKLGLRISWLEPYLETYSRGKDIENWLAAQEEELGIRASEVEAYAQELKTQEEQLEESIQKFIKEETELLEHITKLEEELSERRNIQRLAEIYTEMGAEEAARILEEAGQELALQILTWMDERDAADILTKLPTNLAVALSKQLGQHK